MFEIKESPGKGLGMFATREIQPGELIILEKPLVTFVVIVLLRVLLKSCHLKIDKY